MIDAEVPGNCTSCPVGTYSSEIDSTSCTPCPEGQTTNKKATATASFCHCKFNTESVSKTRQAFFKFVP